MAVTSMWSVKGWLGQVLNYACNEEKTNWISYEMDGFDALDYATNPSKTEEQHLVSGVNCDWAIARQQMQILKKATHDESAIVAYHGYQAFMPDEVTPEQAHQIGVELAQRLWGSEYQVVVATHVDQQHIHNHFVLSPVSILGGNRYVHTKDDIRALRRENDKLCRQYQLNVITNPRKRKIHFSQYQAMQNGEPTWMTPICADIDSAITKSVTFTDFMEHMQALGYEITRQGDKIKHMSIRPPGRKKPIRMYRLGDAYAEDEIKRRILEQRHGEPVRQSTPVIRIHHQPFRCQEFKPKRLRGLKAVYFRHLYQLGILPKRNKKKMEYRAQRYYDNSQRLLEAYSNQGRFLFANNIETLGEVAEKREQLVVERDELRRKRKSLYNMKRYTKEDDPQLLPIYQNITAINAELKDIGRDISACNGIMKRAERIIEQMRVEQGNRREAIQHAIIRPLGRSGAHSARSWREGR